MIAVSIGIAIIVILSVALIACCMRMRALSVRTAQAQRSDRMKRSFLHNLSHQIRTPLHSVTGMAEVIADDTLYLSKSEKRNISDQIKYNASLIATLFDEVLLLMGDDAEGHAIEKVELSPNALCRRCLEATFHQSEHPEVRLHFNRELSDEFFIKSDPHLIELILDKLLINSCRFTQKGEISVGCNITENPDCLTIYVQDTGIGIPTEREDSLFNWFDRPDDMRDEAEMDLSIAQKLAARVGGLLRHDEHYQNGTRMQLILPIR